jgi:hypothetical protein
VNQQRVSPRENGPVKDTLQIFINRFIPADDCVVTGSGTCSLEPVTSLIFYFAFHLRSKRVTA